MAYFRPIVIVLLIGLGSLVSAAPGQLPPENIAAAQALLPLLKDLRMELEPHFRTGSGRVPPSPITGRSSTLFAITLGRRAVDVDKEVLHALDRLLKWDPVTAPGSVEAVLFDEFLQNLRVKTSGTIAMKSADFPCDTDCVVQHLTRLDETLGRSRKEREELRDYLLLESLTAAVK